MIIVVVVVLPVPILLLLRHRAVSLISLVETATRDAIGPAAARVRAPPDTARQVRTAVVTVVVVALHRRLGRSPDPDRTTEDAEANGTNCDFSNSVRIYVS
jgi:hypothetical protein